MKYDDIKKSIVKNWSSSTHYVIWAYINTEIKSFEVFNFMISKSTSKPLPDRDDKIYCSMLAKEIIYSDGTYHETYTEIVFSCADIVGIQEIEILPGEYQ